MFVCMYVISPVSIRITRITDPIAILIELLGVERIWTVVAGVAKLV